MSGRKRLSRTPRDTLWLLVTVVLFLSVLGFLAIWFSGTADSEPKVLVSKIGLRFPVADLNSGSLRLFSYPLDSSTEVPFVVQRGEDNVIRVAFAFCRRCFGAPHYEWRNQLICGGCNHAMELPNVGDKPGDKTDCVPVAIPYAVENNELVVDGQVLAQEFLRWYPTGKAAR